MKFATGSIGSLCLALAAGCAKNDSAEIRAMRDQVRAMRGQLDELRARVAASRAAPPPAPPPAAAPQPTAPPPPVAAATPDAGAAERDPVAARGGRSSDSAMDREGVQARRAFDPRFPRMAPGTHPCLLNGAVVQIPLRYTCAQMGATDTAQ